MQVRKQQRLDLLQQQAAFLLTQLGVLGVVELVLTRALLDPIERANGVDKLVATTGCVAAIAIGK
jgi:hypothetical protein